MRHLARDAMAELGVVEEDAADIQLALTEACANVMDHSGAGDAYRVVLDVRPGALEVQVIDTGHGFDHGLLPEVDVGPEAEHGRGIGLMRAFMDQVRFSAEPEDGTVVHLVKRVSFDDAATARRLLLPAPAPDLRLEPG